MPLYDVFVVCDECGEIHRTPMGLGLADGPAGRASVGDVFGGQQLPPDVLKLVNTWTECPNTGKMVRQEDQYQVFLVAVEE